jgi:hypothetical protein
MAIFQNVLIILIYVLVARPLFSWVPIDAFVTHVVVDWLQ